MHYRPTGDVVLDCVFMDPDPLMGYLPDEAGSGLVVVQNAVAGATLYGPLGLVMIDVPDHPFANYCCTPDDTLAGGGTGPTVTRRAGCHRHRLQPPQTGRLPPHVPVAAAPHECYHWRSRAWLFEGAAGQIFRAPFVYYDPLLLQTYAIQRYQVVSFMNSIEEAMDDVAAHGEVAFKARLGDKFEAAFDYSGPEIKFPRPIASFIKRVLTRDVNFPLRMALVTVCPPLSLAVTKVKRGLAPGDTFDGGVQALAILKHIASFVAERAHDFYNYPFVAERPLDYQLIRTNLTETPKAATPHETWCAEVKAFGSFKSKKTGEDVFPTSAAVAEYGVYRKVHGFGKFPSQ